MFLRVLFAREAGIALHKASRPVTPATSPLQQRSVYVVSYGEKAINIVVRTVLLNSLAIAIVWFPVVYFWPVFSKKFLLPFACVIGALGCVGSRFIYHEIIPDELAKRILEVIERRKSEVTNR